MSDSNWYYVNAQGQSKGPHSILRLKVLYNSSAITKSTLIWNGSTVTQWTPLNQIPLHYHSHRANRVDYNINFHPLNLLNSNANDIQSYNSAKNSDFKNGERDWIVFKMEEFYLPKIVKLKHLRISNANVKEMRVLMGDSTKNQWFLFNPNLIVVGNETTEFQSFAIHGKDTNFVRSEKYKYIKIEFIKNYGYNDPNGSRFGVHKLELFGIKSL